MAEDRGHLGRRLKTTAEMAAIFGETDPEAMRTTVDICNQVECYSIDHAPIMPTFEIPEEFGTEAEYRARLTEQDLYLSLIHI